MPWEPANRFPHASVLELGALLLHAMLISISLTAYVSKIGLSSAVGVFQNTSKIVQSTKGTNSIGLVYSSSKSSRFPEEHLVCPQG